MKNCNATHDQRTRRNRFSACAAAFSLTFTASLPVSAARVTPPPVPANLQVPSGSKVFLEGHAFGTQNYICLPSGAGFAWTLFGPQATLFTHNDKQVMTHFLSPNPSESDTPRATWQDSKDTSAVWGVAMASSSDPTFVEAGAIPWLLLRVVGTQDGGTGGEKLAETIFIQRLTTSGGIAPSTGCAVSTDVGKRAFVPYEADYFFYMPAR